LSTPTYKVSAKTMPPGILGALSEVFGHMVRDVMVTASDTVQISDAGGSGQRAFACIVADVQVASAVVLWGSWGGPSIATSRGNRVDDLRGDPVEIPERGAIITGRTGSTFHHATVWVRATTFPSVVLPGLRELWGDNHAAIQTMSIASDAAVLGHPEASSVLAESVAVPMADLSELDSRVLYCFGALKAGEYRREALKRIARGDTIPRTVAIGDSAVEAVVDTLVARGFLKRLANGSVTMTPQGRALRRPSLGAELWGTVTVRRMEAR